MPNRLHQTVIASLLASACAMPAAADVPQVSADIGPVHGLVARVMQGLGEPALIVRQGATPHGYSLSPSEARALQESDLVFWVGPELEPWLGGVIETLAGDAEVIALLDAPGTETLPFCQGATFEAHDHGDHDHGEHDHGDHDHGDHDHGEHDHEHGDHDHAHEDADADAHVEHGDEGHHHSHDGADPHAWLDPHNAQVWLGVIAEALAEADPENAATYEANAEEGRAEIETAAEEVRASLAPVQGLEFVVFHDAYQYFETSFGMTAAGAISVGDASDPSPARVAEIRETVEELGVSCVFSEPQFNQGLVETVLEGADGHSGTIDPLGSDIALGPDFYPAFLTAIGEAIVSCAE
ncbi:zinc ABC transporter substrate-binding protein [Pseudoroseicyclus aestuarii]|nr:zinc ABC transporter substrate-binding protein [Pseudoroseicyclus aestuarii]